MHWGLAFASMWFYFIFDSMVRFKIKDTVIPFRLFCQGPFSSILPYFRRRMD